MPSPGGRPARARERGHRGAHLGADLLGDGGAVEHARGHQLCASAACASSCLSDSGRPSTTSLSPASHQRVRLGVELHPPILPLDADDDDAVPLAQVRLEDRLVRQRRRRRDRDLLHRQLQVVGARGELHEVDHRRPQRRLRHLHARRSDTARARGRRRRASASIVASSVSARPTMNRSGRITRALSTA